MGLLSASAKAAVLLRALSLHVLSQGLRHFLRCLSKTPREQFFFENHIHGAFHWALVSCQCFQDGFRAPFSWVLVPLCPRLVLCPHTPPPRFAGIFMYSRSKQVASAGTSLCLKEGTCLIAPESKTLCGLGGRAVMFLKNGARVIPVPMLTLVS